MLKDTSGSHAEEEHSGGEIAGFVIIISQEEAQFPRNRNVAAVQRASAAQPERRRQNVRI